MFTQTAQNLGLLKLDFRTNLLSIVTYDIQVSIIQQVSHLILTNLEQFQRMMMTDEHCIFYMEFLGAGMKLPINCIDTMTNCFKVYEDWFLKREHTPVAIQKRFNDFRRSAIDHLSLMMFKKEVTNQNQVYFPKYCALCMNVIEMLRKLSRTLPKESDDKERMFKLLIASAEDICGKEWPDNQLVHVSQVCGNLIRLFYEMLIDNANQNIELWKVVKKLHHKWINIQSVAVEWVKISKILQKTCLDFIYIQHVDNGVLALKNDEFEFNLNTKTQLILKIWMHFIHFVGNPANIKLPIVLKLIEEGFFELISQMIEYSTKSNNPNDAPDVNLILTIYYDSLNFPVIHNDHVKYSDGVGFCLMSIFKLFESFIYVNEIDKYFLTKIYNAMAYAIDTKDNRILSLVFKQLKIMFERRIPGIEILYPNIITSIENFFSKMSPASVTSFKTEVLNAFEIIRLIQFTLSRQRNTMKISSIPKQSASELTYNDFIVRIKTVLLNIIPLLKDIDILDSYLLCLNRLMIDLPLRPDTDKQLTIQIQDFMDGVLKMILTKGKEWFDQLTNIHQLTNIIELLRIFADIVSILPNANIPLIQVFQLLGGYIDVNFKTSQNIHPFLSLHVLYFTKAYDYISQGLMISTLRMIGKITAYFNDQITRGQVMAHTFKYDSELLNAIYDNILPDEYKDNAIDEKQVLTLFKKHQISNPNDYMKIFYDSQTLLTYIDLAWTSKTRFHDVLVISRTPYTKQTYIMQFIDDNETWNIIDFKPESKNVTCGIPQLELTASWNEKKYNTISGIKSLIVTKQQWKHTPLPKTEVYSEQNFNFSTIRTIATALHTNEMHKSTLIPLIITEKLLNEIEEIDKLRVKVVGSVTINTTTNTTAVIEFMKYMGKVIDSHTFTGYKSAYANQPIFMNNSNCEMDIIYNVPSIYQTPNELKGKEDVIIEWKQAGKIEVTKNVEETNDEKLKIIIEENHTDVFRVITNKQIGLLDKIQYVNIDALGILLRKTAECFIRSKNRGITQVVRRNAIDKLISHRDDINPHGEINLLFNESFRSKIKSNELSFITTEPEILAPINIPQRSHQSHVTGSSPLEFNNTDLSPSPSNVPSSQQMKPQTPTLPARNQPAKSSPTAFGFRKASEQRPVTYQQPQTSPSPQKQKTNFFGRPAMSSSHQSSVSLDGSSSSSFAMNRSAPQKSPSPNVQTTSPATKTSSFQSSNVSAPRSNVSAARSFFASKAAQNSQTTPVRPATQNYPQTQPTQTSGVTGLNRSQPSQQAKHMTTTSWQMGGSRTNNQSSRFIMGNRMTKDLSSLQQQNKGNN